MLLLEYKLKGHPTQYAAIEDAIRTANFIRNKCLRLWMDTKNIGKYDLNNYCVPLSKEFVYAKKLNSQARQASAERAWVSISRFYRECKNGSKITHPRFKKQGVSVEYKASGWKLSEDRRFINFTDGFKIGKLKLLNKRILNNYALQSIKRVRIVRKSDGYYCQFVTDIDRKEIQEPNGSTVGIDMGLFAFYTDSNGKKVPCLKLLRKSEIHLNRLQRRLSRKQKGSRNRNKAKVKLARRHLKVSRQRKDFAVKAASALVRSNDLIAYEHLQVRNLVKNHYLAKSIHDAAWSGFLTWVNYYGKVFGKVIVAVPPAYTSQDCSACGVRVKKALSERSHTCECGYILDRDHNAARNILQRGLELLSNDTVGHTEISTLEVVNAWGKDIRPAVSRQPLLNQEFSVIIEEKCHG